jgi:hypothetical protein
MLHSQSGRRSLEASKILEGREGGGGASGLVRSTVAHKGSMQCLRLYVGGNENPG